MAERTGIVESKGKPLTLLGDELNVGDPAPDFNTYDTNLQPIKLSDFKGKIVVLSTVPSLDTQICSIETKHFNREAQKLNDVVFITVSMDLPFAQKRWATDEDVNNIRLASDYKERNLGMTYGVLVKETYLLARTVFVIDKEGKIAYIQYVKETASEPDYDDVLDAVKKLI
jgi:thiol peroxidase